MNGLELWEKVEKTDPEHTKAFTKGGGFKGTAIKPIYLIKKATELWGPAGLSWGWNVIEEKLIQGAPMIHNGVHIGFEQLHSVLISLYYPSGKEKGHGYVESYGHTLVTEMRSGSYRTDDEAPKKSLTDAIGKALHYLGFSADVYFGQFDGSKYETKDGEKAPVPTQEDLGKKLAESIEHAKAGKEIEEQINGLTELDTTKAAMLLVSVRAMPEGAAKERRKELLRNKVKGFNWVTTQTGEGASSVITFSIGAGK